jgi:RHS repeat-associated protein
VAPGNQASGVAGIGYTYDPRGRVVERLDPALGARDELDWDPMNRLVGWRRFTPADAPEPSAEATYAWDGLGNLLVRTVGDDTWRYFWSQGRLVTVWRNNSEEFVLHRDPSDGSLAFARYGGDLFAVLTDEAGTPVELRDENGAEAGSRRHAVFGARLVDTFTAPLPIGFTGALTDDASGLLLLGRRVYDPRTGRFLSPDPAGYADGWNLYRYARNNPLAWADPTGLESEPCCDDAMKQQIDKLQDEIDFTYDALDATKSMRDKLYEQHQDAVLDLMNTIQAPDGGELGDYDAAEVDSIKDLGRGGGTYSPEDTFSPDLTDPYVKEGQLQRQLDIVDADLEAQRDHVNRITGELAHLLAICSK